MKRMTHERANGIKTGYWSPATKEELVQRLAAYENTGLEPWEIGRAIEKAAKDAESATAAKMAECIAGGIKDTVEAIHRDFDGFFKRGRTCFCLPGSGSFCVYEGLSFGKHASAKKQE